MKRTYYLMIFALLLATCTNMSSKKQDEPTEVTATAEIGQTGMEYSVESLRVSLNERIEAFTFGNNTRPAATIRKPVVVPISASEAIKANGVPE